MKPQRRNAAKPHQPPSLPDTETPLAQTGTAYPGSFDDDSISAAFDRFSVEASFGSEPAPGAPDDEPPSMVTIGRRLLKSIGVYPATGNNIPPREDRERVHGLIHEPRLEPTEIARLALLLRAQAKPQERGARPFEDWLRKACDHVARAALVLRELLNALGGLTSIGHFISYSEAIKQAGLTARTLDAWVERIDAAFAQSSDWTLPRSERQIPAFLLNKVIAAASQAKSQRAKAGHKAMQARSKRGKSRGRPRVGT